MNLVVCDGRICVPPLLSESSLLRKRPRRSVRTPNRFLEKVQAIRKSDIFLAILWAKILLPYPPRDIDAVLMESRSVADSMTSEVSETYKKESDRFHRSNVTCKEIFVRGGCMILISTDTVPMEASRLDDQQQKTVN